MSLFSNNLVYFSMRNYTVPDPPGLFDGHVWPMYLKHRLATENCGLDIRKSANIAIKWHSQPISLL